jgi:hypothetical protein
MRTVAVEFSSGSCCPGRGAPSTTSSTMTVSTPTRPGRHCSTIARGSSVTPPSFLSSLSELSLRRRCWSPSAPTRNASLSEPTPWSTTSSAHPSETARLSSSASHCRPPLLLCVVSLVPELPRLRLRRRRGRAACRRLRHSCHLSIRLSVSP